jgi:HSP20 family protein
MTSITEKPAEKAETQPATGESKPLAEQPRHPLLSLRDEIDRLFEDFAFTTMRSPFRTRLFDLEPFRRFESAFSGAVPTAEVAEKDNDFVVTVELRESTRRTSI